jgi:hypothetical protein
MRNSRFVAGERVADAASRSSSIATCAAKLRSPMPDSAVVCRDIVRDRCAIALGSSFV